MKIRSGLAVLATAAAFMFAAVAPAHADTNTGNIDPTRTGSITLHKHTHDDNSLPGEPAGNPVEGIEFTIYQVVDDGHPIDLTTPKGWEQVAVAADRTPDLMPTHYLAIEHAKGVTDSTGPVVFDNLPLSLYVVSETGYGHHNVTEPNPDFFVTVPMPGDQHGSWVYDVVAWPKNVITPPTPSKPPVKGGTHGRIQGGIPVPGAGSPWLTVAGVLLLAAAATGSVVLGRRRSSSDTAAR